MKGTLRCFTTFSVVRQILLLGWGSADLEICYVLSVSGTRFDKSAKYRNLWSIRHRQRKAKMPAMNNGEQPLLGAGFFYGCYELILARAREQTSYPESMEVLFKSLVISLSLFI